MAGDGKPRRAGTGRHTIERSVEAHGAYGQHLTKTVGRLLSIVRCIFVNNDQELVDEWVWWLKDKHIDEVIEAGADSAEIVRMDASPTTFEIRYSFRNRDAFDRYEANEAPRLRADGLATFPLERGLKYERNTGEVVD